MRIGSLFSGYGGLDMAAMQTFNAELAWYSEIEPAACTVMKAHHPNVDNIGDVTQVDWSKVEPIDILTGGYPCQPFSTAGKRLGTNDERHLWPYVRQAISVLEPRLVILENVRGHLTLGFDVVLGEISELGYDARWGIVRASDAGAPHQRARLFILAYPSSERLSRRGTQPSSVESQTRSTGHSAKMGSKSLSWGKYEPTIRRWEQHTRPAPEPAIERDGRPRLNPYFVEWMMGLPEGHVTSHGLSAAKELKMLGNGVVPQQAMLALRLLKATDLLDVDE